MKLEPIAYSESRQLKTKDESIRVLRPSPYFLKLTRSMSRSEMKISISRHVEPEVLEVSMSIKQNLPSVSSINHLESSSSVRMNEVSSKISRKPSLSSEHESSRWNKKNNTKPSLPHDSLRSDREIEVRRSEPITSRRIVSRITVSERTSRTSQRS